MTAGMLKQDQNTEKVNNNAIYYEIISMLCHNKKRSFEPFMYLDHVILLNPLLYSFLLFLFLLSFSEGEISVMF